MSQSDRAAQPDPYRPAAPGNLTDHVPDRLARIFLRPLATPLPMGFLAVVVATTVFSAIQLGWISPVAGSIAAQVVLILCVPVMLIACIFGFLSRDPVAGTGMGMLALGWGSIGIAVMTTHLALPTPGEAVILYALSGTLLVPIVASFGKPVAGLVMLLTAGRFAVTATAGLASSYHWPGAVGWTDAAGWVGIALAAVALYAAMAFELEGIAHKAVLPVPRMGSAKTDAAHVDLDEQAPDLLREAGVRQQL
jgi:succinate-acetate transporter protein